MNLPHPPHFVRTTSPQAGRGGARGTLPDLRGVARQSLEDAPRRAETIEAAGTAHCSREALPLQSPEVTRTGDIQLSANDYPVDIGYPKEIVFMKAGVVATALIAEFLMLGGSTTVQAQTGSFARTCNQCWGGGGVINCRCLRINRTWVNASARFSSCPRQSLTNLDGRLVCGP